MTFSIAVIVKMIMFIMLANDKDKDDYDNYKDNDYKVDDPKFSPRL